MFFYIFFYQLPRYLVRVHFCFCLVLRRTIFDFVMSYRSKPFHSVRHAQSVPSHEYLRIFPSVSLTTLTGITYINNVSISYLLRSPLSTTFSGGRNGERTGKCGQNGYGCSGTRMRRWMWDSGRRATRSFKLWHRTFNKMFTYNYKTYDDKKRRRKRKNASVAWINLMKITWVNVNCTRAPYLDRKFQVRWHRSCHLYVRYFFIIFLSVSFGIFNECRFDIKIRKNKNEIIIYKFIYLYVYIYGRVWAVMSPLSRTFSASFPSFLPSSATSSLVSSSIFLFSS